MAVNGTSTARPFELAAFGACMVSQPYPGIAEWFEPGREMIVLKDEKEVADIYRWLLTSDEEREHIGARARDRVLREHTYRHRAEQFIRVMKAVA
jgi:spore maturation protein CgeB